MQTKTVFFEWTKDFETGIAQIDKQHKRLVELLNELYAGSVKAGTEEKEVYDILMQLFDYAGEHFRDEEKLMEAGGYKEIDEHKAEHANFEAKIRNFKSDIKNGYPITFQLIGFLKDWLREHILGSDQKYVSVLKK